MNDVAVVERPAQGDTRRAGRFVWALIAIPLGMFLLFPPFRPPVPWRWATDRVPWQVVARVPWAIPTEVSRVTAATCGSDAVEAVESHQSQGSGAYVLEAFGHGWYGSGPIEPVGPVPGTFRLLDTNHGIFTPEHGSEGARMSRAPGGVGCPA